MSGLPPEGWIEIGLQELAYTIQYGYTASAKAKSDGPRFLRITDIQDGAVDWNRVPGCGIGSGEEQRFALARGDIVFARTGATTGKSFLIRDCPRSVFASYLIRVRLKPSVDPGFLNLFFQTPSYWSYISENLAGNAQPNCNASKLAALPVSIPPLAEQQSIVAKVEALLARVNAARQRLAKVPAILKRFRHSVLAAASSGRLTADWRETTQVVNEDGHSLLARFQKDRASRLSRRKLLDGAFQEPFELPDTWAWARWHDLVDWITYGFTRPMPHVERGVPIITAKNVSDSWIDFTNVDLTTPEAYAELSEKDRPRNGEILLTKDGSIGRSAIVQTNREFCINQSVAVLRFGGPTGFVPYLLRAIQAPFTQSLVEEGAKGSAIRHISITAFARFPIPVPPLPEQHEIVRRIDALFRLADAIEKRVTAASARADKLTQAILAKAFRGELVPTEAELARREGRSYEPASALLERIQAERASDNGKSNCKPKSAKRRHGT